MPKSFLYIKDKMVLLLAVAIATGVGGLTTVAVTATGNSDGRINACVDNSSKSLSQSSTGGCASNATSLSWYDGPIAYAHLVFNSTTATYNIDGPRSQNISAVFSDPSYPGYVCLTASGIHPPKSISANGGDAISGAVIAQLKDANGWASDPGDSVANFCNTSASASNVGLLTGTQTGRPSDVWVQVY